MTYIDDLGEAMDVLDQSINLLKSALATVEMQKNVAAAMFEKLEKASNGSSPASLKAIDAQQAQMKAMQSLSPAKLQAEAAAAAARPQIPHMPAMPTQPTAVSESAKPTANIDMNPSGPSDSDFTLAITKMSRSYNGFLGGEVPRTLAWFGIEPPNGVLNVPIERRYEFLEALEANAKEEAAG